MHRTISKSTGALVVLVIFSITDRKNYLSYCTEHLGFCLISFYLNVLGNYVNVCSLCSLCSFNLAENCFFWKLLEGFLWQHHQLNNEVNTEQQNQDPNNFFDLSNLSQQQQNVRKIKPRGRLTDSEIDDLTFQAQDFRHNQRRRHRQRAPQY
jgi:hypothetical protein